MKRLQYVDNLRSACMLFGCFVHATTLGPFPDLAWIPLVSDDFRMATFFVLAGFFAMMVLSRRGWSGFYHHRLPAVVVPLIAGTLLLNPVTLWLVYRYHNDLIAPSFGWRTVWDATIHQAPHRGTMVWHLHLWFLVSLSVYVLAAPVLARLVQSRAVTAPVDWLLTGGRARFAPLALSLVVAMASVGVLAAQHLTRTEDVWLLRATLRYLPFFTLGLLLFASPRLWEAAHRLDPALIAVLIGLAVLLRMAPLSDPLRAGIEVVQLAMMRCAITFVLLWVFRRFLDRSGPLARALSTTIYTTYIFHYLLILVMGTAWALVWGPLGPGAALVIATLAGLFGWLIHWAVVSRSATLLFLFNGKLPPPSARKTVPAPE